MSSVAGAGLFGGRWAGYEAMLLVERCAVLRADVLARAGVFKRPTGAGVVAYRSRDDAPATAMAEWQVESLMGERVLHLHSTSGMGPALDEVIALEATPMAWGPSRWWFLCPSRGCGARVGCLYAPHRGERYVCRACAHLTYESRREPFRHRTMVRKMAARMGIHPRGVRWQIRTRRERGWGT